MYKYTEFRIGDKSISAETVDSYNFSSEGNVCTIYLKDGNTIITNERVTINGYNCCCTCGTKIKDKGKVFCDNCVTEHRKIVLEPLPTARKK